MRQQTSAAVSPIVAITSASPDQVVGRMAILNGDGAAISFGTMLDFAAKLAKNGACLALAAGHEVAETECHANVFSRAATEEMNGYAVVLHRNATTMNWRVTLHDERGDTMAAVSLTFAIIAGARDRGRPGREALHFASHARAAPEQGQDGQPSKPGEKRREDIAIAASDIIARKGFANATMREIAAAAGMHVPTMYQYVASKDAMLELVYNWTMAAVRTDVAAATVNCSTATEKLRATIDAIVDKSDRFRHQIGVLNCELRSLSPQARAGVLAEYRQLILQIADLISEGVASGEFRQVDPEISANLIDAACDIWPLRQFAVGQFGLQTFRNQMASLLIRSLVV